MAEVLPYVMAAAATASAGAGVYSATQAGKGGPGPPAPPDVGAPDIGAGVRSAAARLRPELQSRGIVSSPYFEAQEIGEEAFGQFGGTSLEDYMKEAQQFLGIGTT